MIGVFTWTPIQLLKLITFKREESMNILTELQIQRINNININTKKMGLGTMIQSLIEDNGVTGTAVNAVNATAGTLTITAQPTIGDTMTIGTKMYTFTTPALAITEGKISIGTTLATAKLAIVAAIMGTDTVNTAHPLVSASAFVVDVCTITPLVSGVSGNVALTETFTATTNIFSAVALAGGINGTIGTVGKTLIDATYLYMCIADNTVSGKNWRRISLGSVY
jgi:hypothetical protein